MDKNNIYIEEDNDFLNEELLAEVNWAKMGKFLKQDVKLGTIKNLFKKNINKDIGPISAPPKSGQLVLPAGNISTLSPLQSPKPGLLSRATSKVGGWSTRNLKSGRKAVNSQGESYAKDLWNYIKSKNITDKSQIEAIVNKMKTVEELAAAKGQKISPKERELILEPIINRFKHGVIRRTVGTLGSAALGTGLFDYVTDNKFGVTEKLAKGAGVVGGALGGVAASTYRGTKDAIKDVLYGKSEKWWDKLGPNAKKAITGVGGVGLGVGGVLAGSALAAKLIMDTHKHSAWKKGGCDAIKNPIDRRKCKEYVIDEKVDDLNKKLVYDCFDDVCKNTIMDEIKKLSIKKGELTSEF